MAVVEFARHVAGMDGANSAEFDPETPYPVIDLLPEQKEVTDMGGTMRLGADPVKLHDGTRAREIFGEAVIYKRHRHRYEVNNMLRRRLEDEGLVAGGTSPDERLVEIDRAARSPLLRRLPVPPRVQLAPDPARAAVPRVRRRGGQASGQRGPAEAAPEESARRPRRPGPGRARRRRLSMRPRAAQLHLSALSRPSWSRQSCHALTCPASRPSSRCFHGSALL